MTSRCPCRNLKGTEFQTITDLGDIGVVIYRHVQRNINEDPTRITNADTDTYILFNIKDIDITSAVLVAEFERNKTSCRRCRYIVEHTQKLLQSVSVIEKNDIRGICDHCRTKPRTLACRKCEASVKRFIIDLRLNTWLQKVHSLLQKATTVRNLCDTEVKFYPKGLEMHDDTKITSIPTIRHSKGKHFIVTSSLRKSRSYGSLQRAKKNPCSMKICSSESSFLDSISKIGKLGPHDNFQVFFRSKSKNEKLSHFSTSELLQDSVNESKYIEKATHSRSKKEIQSENNELFTENITEIKAVKILKKDLNNIIDDEVDKKTKSINANRYINLINVPLQQITRREEVDDEYYKKAKSLKANRSKSPIDDRQQVSKREGKMAVELEQTNESARKEKSKTNAEKGGPVLGNDNNKKGKSSSSKQVTKREGETTNEFVQKNESVRKERKAEANFVSEITRKNTEKGRRTLEKDYNRKGKSFLSEAEDGLEKKDLLRVKQGKEKLRTPAEDKFSSDEHKKQKNKIENNENLIEKGQKDINYQQKEIQTKNKKKEKQNMEINKKSSEKDNIARSKRLESAREIENNSKKDDTIKDNKENEATKKKNTKAQEEKQTESLRKHKYNQSAKSAKSDAERSALKSKFDVKGFQRLGSKKGESPKVVRNQKETEQVARIGDGRQKTKQQEVSLTVRKGKNDQLVSENEIDLSSKQSKRKEKNEIATKDQISLIQKSQREQIKDITIKSHLGEKSNIFKSGGKNSKARMKSSRKPLAEVSHQIQKKKKVSELIDVKYLKKFLDQELEIGLQKAPKKEQGKSTNITPEMIMGLPIVLKHLEHNIVIPDCMICNDSDIDLNFEDYWKNKKRSCVKPAEYKFIKGERILKSRCHGIGVKVADDKTDMLQERKPILYKSVYTIKNLSEEITECSTEDVNTENTKETKTPASSGSGTIKYALSDRQFIEKGWTVLPVEKVVCKEFVYGIRPARPEFDWFKYNEKKGPMQYDTGEKLADFDDNGRGRWYYKNGRIALDYYDSEELNGKQRIVIYSSGELDQKGRSYPITVLATFDYAGNGIIFDHSGKIRLKYNQKSGVVLDRQIGPVSHWKWHGFGNPLELKRVMIETHLNDPEIMKRGNNDDIQNIKEQDEKMLAIEFDNYVKEKNKLVDQDFHPYQIKTKAFKINEEFSLRIMDQASIHIIFRVGSKQLKLNIGMILDNKDVQDIETVEVGQALNSIEKYPARISSTAELQSIVANAQRCGLPNARSDAHSLGTKTALSSFLRPQPRTISVGSITTSNTYGKSKKLSTKNLYYDTRII